MTQSENNNNTTKKKDIYLSDILLIALFLFCALASIYFSITSGSISKVISNIFFLIAVFLFLYKGYELNKLRKLRENLPVLNFFEYYEEELEMLFKYKVPNMTLFFPVIKKESTDELNRLRKKVNLLTITMYALLIFAIVILNLK